LPWADEHTIGETREGRLAIRMGETSGGEVWIKATREKAAYGPGDLVQVFVQVGWGGVNSIRVSRRVSLVRALFRRCAIADDDGVARSRSSPASTLSSAKPSLTATLRPPTPPTSFAHRRKSLRSSPPTQASRPTRTTIPRPLQSSTKTSLSPSR
jgi:hypothetical protein